MGGTSSQTQNQSSNQQSTTNPWASTIAPLQNLVSGVNSQIPNAATTGAQTNAFNNINSIYGAGNQYAPQIGNVANTFLNGGTNLSPQVQSAYDQYSKQVMPWASGAMADPSQNPALASALNVAGTDATNSINGMFAGAGRDLSGANQQAVARGITQAEAPILMGAQQTALDTANNLYGAGINNANTQTGINQASYGLMGQGINAADSANNANLWGPQGIINTGQAQAALPLTNYSQIAGILGPIAGLGGTTSGNSSGTMTGTSTMSPAQQAWGWMNSFANLTNAFKPGGAGGFGGSGGSGGSGGAG